MYKLIAFLTVLGLAFFSSSVSFADKLCIKDAKVIRSKAKLKGALFVAPSCGRKGTEVLDTSAFIGAAGAQGPAGPSGPTGAPGANGILGYEVVSSEVTVLVNSLSNSTQTATCPSGKVVLGGSCTFTGSDSIFFVIIGTKIVPGNPDKYECIIRNPSGSNRNITITTKATCGIPS